MRDFILHPFPTSGRLPEGVAITGLVEFCGDTVAAFTVLEDGGFILERQGSCIGTFDTVAAMFRKLRAMRLS